MSVNILNTQVKTVNNTLKDNFVNLISSKNIGFLNLPTDEFVWTQSLELGKKLKNNIHNT